MALGLTRKLLDGARGTAGVAAEAVRYVAWYLAYQMDGTARDDEQPPGKPTGTRQRDGREPD